MEFETDISIAAYDARPLATNEPASADDGDDVASINDSDAALVAADPMPAIGDIGTGLGKGLADEDLAEAVTTQGPQGWSPWTGVHLRETPAPVETTSLALPPSASMDVATADNADTTVGCWLLPAALGGACALLLLTALYAAWACRLWRRGRRRCAKLPNRRVDFLQFDAGDPSFHRAICQSPPWKLGQTAATAAARNARTSTPLSKTGPVYRISSPKALYSDSQLALGTPEGDYPRLVGSRPRLASFRASGNSDVDYSGSGITLSAEVLDDSYYSGTITRRSRMSGHLAQAIAAFDLPHTVQTVRTSESSVSSGSHLACSSPPTSRSPDGTCSPLQPDANGDSRLQVIYQERTAV